MYEVITECVKAKSANGERRQGPKLKGLECELLLSTALHPTHMLETLFQ